MATIEEEKTVAAALTRAPAEQAHATTKNVQKPAEKVQALSDQAHAPAEEVHTAHDKRLRTIVEQNQSKSSKAKPSPKTIKKLALLSDCFNIKTKNL